MLSVFITITINNNNNNNIVMRAVGSRIFWHLSRIVSMRGYLCRRPCIETCVDLVHLISSNKQRLYSTSLGVQGQQHRLIISQMERTRRDIPRSLHTNYVLHSVSRVFGHFCQLGCLFFCLQAEIDGDIIRRIIYAQQRACCYKVMTC